MSQGAQVLILPLSPQEGFLSRKCLRSSLCFPRHWREKHILRPVGCQGRDGPFPKVACPRVEDRLVAPHRRQGLGIWPASHRWSSLDMRCSVVTTRGGLFPHFYRTGCPRNCLCFPFRARWLAAPAVRHTRQGLPDPDWLAYSSRRSLSLAIARPASFSNGYRQYLIA